MNLLKMFPAYNKNHPKLISIEQLKSVIGNTRALFDLMQLQNPIQ